MSLTILYIFGKQMYCLVHVTNLFQFFFTASQSTIANGGNVMTELRINLIAAADSLSA
jgi:hypothetical protein